MAHRKPEYGHRGLISDVFITSIPQYADAKGPVLPALQVAESRRAL
jgi:hypothetical protein